MITKRKLLPPLDYFLAFEAAAKRGSFAGAVADLNISETAISRKVRLLEQHFDCQFFVRGHRSISLTPQGVSLLQSVSRALDDLRATSQELVARHQADTVTLAATNSVSSLWLMPRLGQFNQNDQTLRIMLVSSDNDEECMSQENDLIILRGEGNWPGFHAQLLFGETIFPVCAPSYLAQHPEAGQLDLFPNLDLIEISSTHTEWMNWTTWLERQHIPQAALMRAVYFNTYPLAVQAAVDGLGIALGWGHLVDRLLETGALVRPLAETHVRTTSGYYLLKHQSKKPFSGQAAVEHWLLEHSAARKRYGPQNPGDQTSR